MSGLVAALAVGASAAPAAATAAITPSVGPAIGGTGVTIAALSLGFTQIAAGSNTGYALGTDGWVYSWGYGGGGELGDGTTTSSTSVVRVLAGAIPAGVTITQIAAGWNSAYALGSNGDLFAWGANGNGQLGDGTTTQRDEPVLVERGAIPMGVTITQLAAGAYDAYALGSDGHVYSWGYDLDGELGDGHNVDSATPVAVVNGAIGVGVTATQIAAGQGAAYIVGSDGHAYSWGSDTADALGAGGAGDSNVPVRVSDGAIPPGVGLTAVAAGQEGGYALGNDGHVYAWGDNSLGDLGDGGTTASSVPVLVSAGAIPAGVTLTTIGGGSSSGYALGSDGKAYGWGNDGESQLGDGASGFRAVPVATLAGAVPVGVTLIGIAGGYHTAIALGSDGAVYGWGDNNGALGDGTTVNRGAPVLGANVIVTEVLFGATAGTALSESAGRISVVSPAHGSGTVGVTLRGAISSGASTGALTMSTALESAFTYGSSLAPTGLGFFWWLFGAACAALAGGALALTRQHRRRLRHPPAHTAAS